MGANAVISLDKDLIDSYAKAAAVNGRSLEEELRAALASTSGGYVKNSAALLRLSDAALAMTPPDGPDGSDSTLLIRWDRDTNHGEWTDDGWDDHDAGR